MKRQPGKHAKVASRTAAPRASASLSLPADRWRVLLLAGLTAIYVARPLLPSETPTTTAGDGLPFVMLTLVLFAAWLLSQFSGRRSPCGVGVSPAPENAGVSPAAENAGGTPAAENAGGTPAAEKAGGTPALQGGLRCGVAEVAWALLMGWLAVSAMAALSGGYARAGVNGFWEWTGLGLGFLLLRQLLRTTAEKRALLVVMACLALVLATDGLFDFAVEKPLARELYRRNPEKVLAAANIDAPPGSQGRALFEQRLASSEPTATFALANSLAGFFVPWLLVALAIGWLGEDGPPPAFPPWRRWMAAAVLVLPMAACLLLTKSRAGYLATLVGFALLAFVSRRGGRQLWLLLATLAGMAAVLVGTGLTLGVLDREIVSEAFKSLRYRWQYWQGALGIVAEHPWIGCGPGNFQDEYTRFKLPEASEVVADPHSFLFEIWSVAGTPALLAFIAILIGIAMVAFRSAKARSFAERKATRGDENQSDDQSFSWAIMTAAGVAGFLLAYLVGLFTTVGLPWPVLATGCVVLPVVSACLAGWIRRGSLPTCVPFCAALALLINLLAAGGISFSGVAGSLWLLAAAGMHGDERQPQAMPRGALIGLGLLIAAMFIACYLTAYRPVLACRRAISQAMRHPKSAREHLLAAAAADPLADEPWRMLAEGDFSRWLRDVEGSSEDWEQDQREVLQRRPHASAAWHEAGMHYLTAADRAPAATRSTFLSAAIEHLRCAAELYPNSPLIHAHLAIALGAAEHSEAREQAALALELHAQTPHLDQKLPTDVLPQVQDLVGKQ